MTQTSVSQAILSGETYLGIELGSTRIKAVLIGEDHMPLASGGYGWENSYENGIWTYDLQEVWKGLQQAYGELAAEVKGRYDVTLTKVKCLGISGMMHGYLPLDAKNRLLTPFRTWRNTITGEAAEVLTKAFSFNIPQRWSVAHLYQAILNKEAHVGEIAYLTTLAGYVHYQLTGCKVMGIGEASGMFPIDCAVCDYDAQKLAAFDALTADCGYGWKLRDILPEVLPAGREAGRLTEEGARLLDPTGNLQAGIPLCPPEGDAGTGMTATNAVGERTGNVSAGTSVFAMLVMEKPLSRVYPELDVVTTPGGKPVVMVHCNNCTNEINAWAQVFRGFLEAIGQKPDMNQIFTVMFQSALQGEKDGGKLLLYNFLSGEHIAQLEEGRPLMVRTPDAELSFPNFMRVQMYAALATLSQGMEILREEKVRIDRLMGHGGFFKTPGVGQRMLAAVMESPVCVMENAGEGGPWGMALLAAYAAKKAEGETLEEYLEHRVFAGQKSSSVEPDAADVAGFRSYMQRYQKGLAAERTAVESIR